MPDGRWWGEFIVKDGEFMDELVRCKDCIHRGIEGECPLYESAYITGSAEGSNFYCAWGERSNDD